MKSLTERTREIEQLMQYAVPEDRRTEAFSLLHKHAGDGVALSVFHNFYSFLPEGLDDAIAILCLLARKESKFLLSATTAIDDYLYLADTENAVFLGPLREGIWEDEVLHFFGYKDREAFTKAHRDPAQFPVYVPACLDQHLCPVCHAAEGEYHTLGCPVEVCPWCGGQLTSCPCRFSRLGIHEMDRETQVDELLDLLNAQGRIPFDAARQSPAYPVTPADLGGD